MAPTTGVATSKATSQGQLTAQQAAAVVGIHPHPVIQHVADMLESHLLAVANAARSGNPALRRDGGHFAYAVLEKLEDLGVEFRTHIEDFKAKLDAALSVDSSEANTNTGSQGSVSTAGVGQTSGGVVTGSGAPGGVTQPGATSTSAEASTTGKATV